MKRILKRCKKWLLFQKESYLDGLRFLNSTPWAGRIPLHSLAQLESDIVRRYHVVEKGLSMPDFRPRFGKDSVSELVAMLGQWDRRSDTAAGDTHQIIAARNTVESYRRKHQELGIDVGDLIGDGSCCDDESLGGVKAYRPLPKEVACHFDEIVRTRVSVRAFDAARDVPQELIRQSISQAICAPSVCNRQTWRVHQYSGEEAQKILKLQSGNRGFGHTIPCVLVVTSDLRYFTGTAERYQAWIDGGMFAMLLLLALHAQGLGAVALNWSVLNRRDVQLRKQGNIPGHERVIMLIGCGYPAEGITVPKSHRRTAESILTRHP
jgi:nitroreductase